MAPSVSCPVMSKILVNYLDIHKLCGRKSQTYAVWKKLTILFLESRHLDLTKEELKAKAQKVKNFNQLFQKEGNVYSQEETLKRLFPEFE
jgi:hypothetical protein